MCHSISLPPKKIRGVSTGAWTLFECPARRVRE
jgi:hypothetical protein